MTAVEGGVIAIQYSAMPDEAIFKKSIVHVMLNSIDRECRFAARWLQVAGVSYRRPANFGMCFYRDACRFCLCRKRQSFLCVHSIGIEL